MFVVNLQLRLIILTKATLATMETLAIIATQITATINLQLRFKATKEIMATMADSKLPHQKLTLMVSSNHFSIFLFLSYFKLQNE